ncbi:thiazole/oxazole-forming peptide maturase SagD family component [Rhizobium subbaraonis]|uniref:Thiazole/oxazole-forming peptide maturase SagD family component n=1 Tax=Rhizobium subbaraonis TaxID=908946 RepID=A0A285UJT7_9HYPH|nr:YcaO-like family protein [Rhizobium subbaraonis]SOC40521.1 thiazole/oxazole-forming peptide maturase SagD family component [Rhizobium subbaraonis]
MDAGVETPLQSLFEIVPINPPAFPVHLTIAMPRVPGEVTGPWLPDAARPGSGRLVAGRGLTADQARMSCAGEAAELVSCACWGDEPLVRASFASLGKAAIHPASLLLASDEQYERRAGWNLRHGGYDWLPERFDEHVEVEWVEAFSPDGSGRAYVTAAQCLIGYGDRDAAGTFAVADSNGCAAGRTREDAAVSAFLELVERDATALWWYGRHRRPAVPLDGVPGAPAIVAWLGDRGRTCHLLDITTDFGIAARAAVSADARGGTVAIGVAAHFDPHRAGTAAMTEMMQTLYSLDLRRAMPAEPGDPFQFWLDTVSCAAMPHLVPAGSMASGADGNAPMPATLDQCARLCRDRGLRLLVIDMTRARLGVPAARVIVPGLRPLSARFAAGRLFDVPMQLGWCSRPRRIAELNDVPFI